MKMLPPADLEDGAAKNDLLRAGFSIRLHPAPILSRTLVMNILRVGLGLAAALLAAGCATRDRDHVVLVSVPEQKLTVLTKGVVTAEYPVSTSKYGLGDTGGSYATPLGKMEIAQKIGGGARPGTVFKSRRATREIVPPNAPGRDPIVSRIIWLKGDEMRNRNAFARYIYIHGTPEERKIGQPASYGCIRMKSADVIELFNVVGIGAIVQVDNRPTELMLAGAPVSRGAAGMSGNSKLVSSVTPGAAR